MKVRKILIGLFIVIPLTIALAYVPIWGWFFDIFKGSDATISQLLITTTKSSAKIYIDGQARGSTEADKELSITGIKKGKHKIQIERDSEPVGFYEKFEKSIDFIPGTAVQIIWDAGPTLESSSGVIKYFQKQIVESSPKIKISTFPTDASIAFDGVTSNANIEVEDTKVHKINIAKDNYINQEISVQMTKSNGEQITGYDLVVEVYLYKNPILDL